MIETARHPRPRQTQRRSRLPAPRRSGSRRSTRSPSRRSISTRSARPIPSPTSSAPAVALRPARTSRPSICSPAQRRQRHGPDRARPAARPRPRHRARCSTGKPVYARGPAMELTTPTGAAVAVTLATRFGALPPMKHRRHRATARATTISPSRPTCCASCSANPPAPTKPLAVSVIEANIDDLNPQVLGLRTERLLEAGALDVTLQPIVHEEGPPRHAAPRHRQAGGSRDRSPQHHLRRNLHARPPHLPRRAPRAARAAGSKSRRPTARSASKSPAKAATRPSTRTAAASPPQPACRSSTSSPKPTSPT